VDLYSVVCVRDRATSQKWFEVFFGRPADEVIGEEYLWQAGANAWIVIDDRSVRCPPGNPSSAVTRAADHVTASSLPRPATGPSAELAQEGGRGAGSRSCGCRPDQASCFLPMRFSAIEVVSPSEGMITHAAR